MAILIIPFQAAKQLKESVDKSFRTNANRKEDLEHRKKRTKEHELGVAVSSAVNETLSTKVSPPLLDGLVRDAGRLSHHGAATDGNYDRNHPSPLNDVFEKYGQFAMFVGNKNISQLIFIHPYNPILKPYDD